MIRVLFVCTGNICRSPMADAVFQDMVEKAGLADQIEADSAGTTAYHVGETAHRGTLKKLREADIDYGGRSRLLIEADLETFDYVLAMDASHLRQIRQMAGKDVDTEVAMFLSYANEDGTTQTTDVIDPYYNNKFDLVYDLVEKGCRSLLSHIRAEHDL